MFYNIRRLKTFKGEIGRLPTDKSDYAGTVYTADDFSIGYYNKISRGKLNEMVPAAREKIWMVTLTMYFRKHSGLAATANGIIDQLITHGFVQKWKNDHKMSPRQNIKEKDPQILTLEQVQGVIFICLGLHVVATALFVLEMLSVKWCCGHKIH